MPSWWGRSSSKDSKKKKNKENRIEAPQLLGPSRDIGSIKPVLSRKYHTDFIAVKGSRSRVASRSLSPSSEFIQWQSFSDTQAKPLPTPETQSCGITRVSSETNMTTLEKRGKAPLSLPIPKREDISTRSTPLDTSGGVATASESSDYSIGSDVHADPNVYNPTSISYGSPLKDVVGNHLSLVHKNHPSHMPENFLEESPEPLNREDNSQFLSRSPRGLVSAKTSCILNSQPGGPCLNECPVDNQYRRSSMPNSSQISSQSSKETEHLFWPQNGCSPEYSRLSSPKKLSPGPISRKQNEVVTLLHPWGGGTAPVSPVGRAHSMKKRSITHYYSTPSSRQISPGPSPRVQSGSVTPRVTGMSPESPTCPADEVKKQCHRLPLPPMTSLCTPFSPLNSTSNNSPAIPCSPRRHHEIFSGSVSHWKKGKLIGRGTFGHVYVGFNSESGEMCAIKEVTLFSDDDKLKESAKQLEQEILLLSTLRHKNIVQYYGSATIEDKLHIYLEYVSGGSIHKLLQDYGHFGVLAIRNYTRQILSGLAYLHNKNTVHRDIKGANILVDPNGCVKLADFGMAKHITGHASLSFKGSPYWMAPEVVRNKSGCNLAVDIWSLGCTILEMATSKPPWSQYEGIAAMFKVGNSKDLPEIPDHLSNDGKDFVMLCLQREPSKRPTANELLQHPFVQSFAQIERPIVNHDLLEPAGDQIGIDTKGIVHAMHLSSLGVGRMAIQDTNAEKPISTSSDCHLNNPSSPISPVGTTLAHSRSPQQNNGRRSPSPISSPLASGSTTPITGGNGAIPVSQMRHIRSPQASWRRSPSPISSPMATSGPSSPLTDGNGAIPLNQVNQTAYVHRGAGNTLLSSHDVLMNELYTLSNSRHDPSEKQATSPVSPYMLFNRPELMDPHKPLYGKLMFADQVSEQLVNDQRILHVTHGLIPGSLNHHGMDGV